MRSCVLLVLAVLIVSFDVNAYSPRVRGDLSVRTNPGGRDADMIMLAGGSRILTRSGQQYMLWDATNGTLLGQLYVPGTRIACMDVSPDGNSVATGTTDGNIQIWDARTETILESLTPDPKFSPPLATLTFSHDGKLIASEPSQMYAGSYTIVTIADKSAVHLPNDVRGVHSLAFSPDDRFLQVRDYRNPSKWYDVATGLYCAPPQGQDEAPMPLPNRSNKSAAAVTSSDGAITVTQEQERADVTFMGRTMPGMRVVSTTLVFNNTKTNTVLRANKEANVIGGLCLTPDGKFALGITGFDAVSIWDTATGQSVRQIPTGFVTSQFIPVQNFESLVVLRQDGTLSRYNTKSGALSWRAPGSTGLSVTSVAVTADGNNLFTSHGNGVLAAWNLKSGALVRSIQGQDAAIVAMALAPDGKKLAVSYSSLTGTVRDQATGGPRNVLRIINPDTFVTLKEIADDDDRFAFNSLAFSPDSAQLMATRSGSGAMIRSGSQPIGVPIFIWDTATWEEQPTPSDSYAGVTFGAYSTDGSRMFIGDGNGLHVYRLPSFDIVKHPDAWMFSGGGGTHFATFSSANDILVEGSDYGNVRFWKYSNDDSANKGHTVVPKDKHSDAVTAGALSPDKLSVATGSSDGTVIVWDIAKHTVLSRGNVSRTRVNSLAYAADGKRLTVGCADGSVKIILAKDCSTIATLQLAPPIPADASTQPDPVTDSTGKPSTPSPIRWITYTPGGYFIASPSTSSLLTGTLLPKESASEVQSSLAATPHER